MRKLFKWRWIRTPVTIVLVAIFFFVLPPTKEAKALAPAAIAAALWVVGWAAVEGAKYAYNHSDWPGDGTWNYTDQVSAIIIGAAEGTLTVFAMLYSWPLVFEALRNQGYAAAVDEMTVKLGDIIDNAVASSLQYQTS